MSVSGSVAVPQWGGSNNEKYTNVSPLNLNKMHTPTPVLSYTSKTCVELPQDQKVQEKYSGRETEAENPGDAAHDRK